MKKMNVLFIQITTKPCARWLGSWKTPVFFLLVLVVASGCGVGGNRTHVVKQYLLEYPPPVVEGLVQKEETIKVYRFSVVQAFNTSSMIYREGSFEFQADPYNNWMATPGEMVSDYLVRDLRKGGPFRAVFSYNDIEDTRYTLGGVIEEFVELSGKERSQASLTVNVTFLDTTKRQLPECVIFQRQYQFVEPLTEKAPAGFAGAMSRAMDEFSRQLIKDLDKAVK
jgi:ABC-type uncharacterized transport system auxiliary subunit